MKKNRKINAQTVKKTVNKIFEIIIKIFARIKNIIICSLIIFAQEILIAILPVCLIVFICILENKPYPYSTIYNNLFIGYTTINAGNTFYLYSGCEIGDKKIVQVLLIFSTISMLCSLAGATIICLGEMENRNISYNSIYNKIYFILSIAVFFVEIIKIYEKCKE